MTKIVPAILARSLDDYKDKIQIVRRLTQRYQLDVVDPDFADNATVDLSSLEFRTDLLCDMHVMSSDPLKYMPVALRVRPNLFIVQYEALANPADILGKLNQKDLKVGLAINPDTTVESIKSLLPGLKHVLIMGYPAGFEGQKFQPKVLAKVAEIRDLAPVIEIGLDGGVNEQSIPKIAKADLDVVNVNTYLFEAGDPLGRYSDMMGELV